MNITNAGAIQLRERIVRLPNITNLGWFVIFETAFYFAFYYGKSFSASTVSPFWFPSSILLCALLSTRPRYWWIFLLAPLPIRLFSEVSKNDALWLLLANHAVDSAKALVAASALRRLLPTPLRLETIQSFAVFAVIAGLLLPAAAAFAGAAVRISLGEPFWQTWQHRFFNDSLAQLILTPAILYFVGGEFRTLKLLSPQRRIEAGLGFGGLILTTYFASHMASSSTLLVEPQFYAPVVFLFWAAMRFGMFGASIAVVIFALSFTVAAAAGSGPFSGQSPEDVATCLRDFLLPRAIAVYLVALCTEETNRTQNFLRESEERFRSVANSAPVFIWTSGRDKLCDFVNECWLNFTGRPLQTQLGNGWAEGVHPHDVTRCLEVYQSAFEARRPFEMEYRLRRRDGEYRWVFDQGVPRYAPNGDFVGYIGSAMDVTDHKRAEELSNALAHHQRVAVIGELSAAIAHEVRQPLNAIMLNSSVICRLVESSNPPLSEIREIVSDIYGDVVRTNDVIIRTRALARKHEIQKQPIDINLTISHVLYLMATEAARRSIRIRTELGSCLPPALGDRTRLQQVLLNLIVNGMDAMTDAPEPARELTVRSKLDELDGIEVLVSDGGCGVAPDLLPHLFEPFFTTKKNGLGLGLAVSRTIVEAHQGRIWATNNSNAGITVHFTVQTVKSDEARMASAQF